MYADIAGLWNMVSTANRPKVSAAAYPKAQLQKRIPFARAGDEALRHSQKDLDARVAACSGRPGNTQEGI
jgi:hypothetical protein